MGATATAPVKAAPKAAAKASAAPAAACTCAPQFRFYVASFAGGLTSGVTGEIFSLVQAGKVSAAAVTTAAFQDAVVLSGVQQVAKDWSKATLKKCSTFSVLATSNPFLFGAATGLPMWALTRAVGTPLQNSRKKNVAPYAGFTKSVVDDLGYHTIKNGLDEYASVVVLSKLLPTLPNFATQKFVEAAVSGIVGGGTYVLAWPYKSVLAGQKLDDAVKLAIKQTPKIAIKKATYTLARPKWASLIQ
jgi:hypothetical protein